MKHIKEQFIRYMDAGFPIIYLNTYEEDKADTLIRSVAGGRKIEEWNVRGYFENQVLMQAEAPLEDILRTLIDDPLSLQRSVLVLKDVPLFKDQMAVIELLKYLARRISNGSLPDFNIVIVSSEVYIPGELDPFLTILHDEYLTVSDIRGVIEQFCRDQEVDMLPEFIRELAQMFKGLSEYEINTILALALSDDGEITRSDLSLILEQKKQVVQKSGILEMIPLKEGMDDIGGLESLKQWLQRKEKIFRNMEAAAAFGVDMPKGVLIAGMPGCGKSLNAKAAAKLFGVPLLRLDMGRLMGKYVGESEANMRKAIGLAEAIAPCVLWIDELEKAFAGVGGSGGAADVTTRLFGTFLTWLQEKDSQAFVVATANNIASMPPELLRKGRFDEIFYVALPNKEERKKIFSIHIGKRRPDDLEGIDLDRLAARTDGYSGADIEGVVKDSIEAAFAKGEDAITTDGILEAVSQTHSLKEIMKDSLQKMESLYKQRKFKNASA